LNREHRFNTLTPNYLKNISRSLETLNVDECVKVIYLTGNKGEHFSNGTDFRTLLHHKTSAQPHLIASYLEDLYGLQIQTAKLNKPLIGVAPGHSFNSGAALLQATGFPTVTLDSKLSFNDASFGFVPHGGSSYYLSRLPGEIGAFLAITGFQLNGIDAKEIGIAESLVHSSESYEETMSDILLAMDFPVPNIDLLSNKGRIDPWREDMLKRLQSDTEKQSADMFEMTRAK
jgi:enoyl-CoA hydratase/carnithine racemase